MFEQIQAILFDLDGTLIDSAPDLAAAVNKMRSDRNLDVVSVERLRPCASSGARGMIGEAFGIDPEQPDYIALRDEFFANYADCLNQRTVAFAGTHELIEAITALGLRWGVVTNKSARFTDPITRAMPLFASAATIISGDTTAHAKPHPEPLFEAARRLGLAPQRCAYVGDDERDISAGLAAGMVTVAAGYGYLGSTTDISGWGAHLYIETPISLLKWLQKA